VKKANYDKGLFGHYDLAGNAQEWTATDAPTKGQKVLRGTNVVEDASVFDKPGELMANAPSAAVGARSDPLLGFRCAKDK
jgi:formylglycine-generating enzyme required for sulfatase activity